MSYWICCNSCFLCPSADRKLAVTSCGHIICNVCNQKGFNVPGKTPKETVVLLPAEVTKAALLCPHPIDKLQDEKLEEVLVKMKQEMQQMAKKLHDQSAYITKLEHALRHQSSENMDVDERSLFRKPSIVPRLSLISPPQDGRMGTIPHRSSNQSLPANYSASSATVSRFQGTPITPEMSFGQRSGWKSPIFKPLSSFRHSMSSLVCPPSYQTHK
ncbi:hypothetical protein KUCAC02_004655 [Chaenocephalus aceratus]|uniref:Uncharacterized protein n=1 Tax=Chaenocephalus aceratus TaxID=36190 RepID=A0ACB9WZA9_CHAAC|nr:hypothetical protein KUCAC02_004655 [Chaenocephalus aceratus]